MNDAASRLRAARIASGFATASDAASRYGWPTQTYLAHENGSRGYRADRAAEYGRRFGVTPEHLLFGSGENAAVPAETQAALIPIYDVQASAGYGALIDQESIVDRLAFPTGYLSHITSTHPRHLAIIGVKGDSMLPTLAHDDIVMVDTTKTNIAYDGMFVLRYGDALHVKRVSRGSSPDMVRIISANPDYPAVEYAVQDVTPIGKVVWYGKKV